MSAGPAYFNYSRYTADPEDEVDSEMILRSIWVIEEGFRKERVCIRAYWEVVWPLKII